MALQVERFVPSPYILHKKKPVSDVCEHGFVEYFYSKNHPRTTEVLDFVVEGNADHLIVPSQTYIKVIAELSGKSSASTSKTVSDGANACVVNNILQSMFESADVMLSNQSTTKTDKHYGYSALLQTLCNYGDDALETYFELSGFSKDTPGHMNDITGASNKGLAKRRKMFKGKTCRIELIGKIFSPLFFQEKVLPTQVTMRVMLKKKMQDFILMHEPGDFKLEIVDAILMVQKVAVMPALKESYIKLLEEGHPIPYFLKTPSINYYSIDAGNTQYMRDNCFLGKVPSRVVIAMVETEAFHGKPDMNPYNFQHFDLGEICLYKDGTAYPRPLIRMDVENDICADAYHNFMSSIRGAYTRYLPHISMDDYKKGYTLFSFDMSPDQMGSLHPGSALNMNSNIRLEMKFLKPLQKNITLLVYNECDHLMEIHRDRRVTIDF